MRETDKAPQHSRRNEELSSSTSRLVPHWRKESMNAAMRMILVQLMTIVWGTALSISLRAQQPSEAGWETLNQLRPGERIEIIDQRLKTLKGTFLVVSPEAITVRHSKGETVVPRSDVLRIGSHGGDRRKNALKGALLGLAAGLVMGAVADYLDDVDGSDPGSNNGKLGGALVGAAAGAGISAAFPGYRTIYRSPKKTLSVPNP
jgi:hypothetical protein